MIEIESNAKKVNEVFKKYSEKLTDMREMFSAGLIYWRYGWNSKRTNAYNKAFSDTIFDTEGQTVSGRWKRLSGGYQEIKVGKMLEVSGRLRSAVSMKSSESNVNITKDSLTMGVKDIPYARLQHWGHKQLPTEKQKYFFRKMIIKSKGMAMWRGLYSKAVRKEYINYPSRPYFVTANNQIPIRFIKFFEDYFEGNVEKLDETLEKLGE